MDNFINTWFSKQVENNPEQLEKLRQNPIAYFCAEYALSDIMPIYSGGLGVLAGDLIKEANTLGIPLVGVGLLYKKGFFKQVIDTENNQETQPQPINPRTAGLTLVLNNEGIPFIQSIPVSGRKIYFQVWHLKVGIIDMYFLDTDVEQNSPEDRVITETLYGGDQKTRILQEIVLGIGGEKTLFAQGIYPSVYHMNEGHSAFAALGIIHHQMKLTKCTYEEAKVVMGKKLLFTNHTIIAAGNDVFPKDMVIAHLQEYANEVQIPFEELLAKGMTETSTGTKFSMTLFALSISFKVNAVSILHAEKAKQLWPEYEMVPVTNGVNMQTWIHPLMRRKLEDIMLEKNVELEDAIKFLSEQELWEIHQSIKLILVKEIFNITGSIFDKDILTLTWSRRIAEYKRPDLLFLDMESVKRIINNIQKPVQIIIAGKSHPQDETGKAILHNILNQIKELNEPNRIVFLPNYSITLAQILVAGSDVWLNNPIRGYEASGTSGMKSGANGALQFTVKDGWTDEVDWTGKGWVINDADASLSMYQQLENEITGTYYAKENNMSSTWVKMMLATMETVIRNYSTKRMLSDYFSKMYLPSLEAQSN